MLIAVKVLLCSEHTFDNALAGQVQLGTERALEIKVLLSTECAVGSVVILRRQDTPRLKRGLAAEGQGECVHPISSATDHARLHFTL